MFYIEPELRRYLRRLTKPFAKFLENVLKPLYPYSNNWWDMAVLKSFQKGNYAPKRYKELTAKTSLDQFDVSGLFTILKHNWRNLKFRYHDNFKLDELNSSDFKPFEVFIDENFKYFESLLILRNNISHEGNDPISRPEEAYVYLDVIHKFSKIIGAEKSLNKATCEDLIDFLKTKVLKPLEENESLKHIAFDTYKMLDECKTPISVEFFFWYNIYDDRGIGSFKKLTDAGLKTFEYYRKEFKELCGADKEF